MKKIVMSLCLVALTLSCSSDRDEVVTTEETTSSSFRTTTSVNLSLLDTQSKAYPGLTVVMSAEKFEIGKPFTIVRELVADTNGKVSFDLSSLENTLGTDGKTYYFTALEEKGDGSYIIRSESKAILVKKNTETITYLIIR